MKTHYLWVLILLLSNNIALSQTDDYPEIKKYRVKKIQKNLKDFKRIILIENEKYIVKASLSAFEEYLRNFVKEHRHIKDDKNLLNLISSQGKAKDEVNAVEIAKQYKLNDRLDYKTAYMLDKGKCQIIDKEKNEPIKKIKVEYYHNNCAPLCAVYGRRFYVNGLLILEIIDVVS